MTDTIWVPLMVAAIAAGASIVVPMLLHRGEPAALKRIKLLSEAIETMPHGDEGKTELIAARTHLAKRISRSLIGVQGYHRVVRRVMIPVGAIGVLLMLSWAVSGFLDPTLWSSKTHALLFFWGVTFMVASPLFIFYSMSLPLYTLAYKSMLESNRDRRRQREAALTTPE